MRFPHNRVIATTAGCALAAAATFGVGGCSSSGHAAASNQPTPRTSGGPLTCSSSYLGMAVGHQSGIKIVKQSIDVTNNGTGACVLDGYPGVNLLGIAHGSSQYAWTIPWANAPHQPVLLKPGASAHFDLVYVPAPLSASSTPSASSEPSAKATTASSGRASAAASGSAKPAASATPTATATTPPPEYIQVLDITITLPNTFATDQTAWSAWLVLQDKVPHPQTYVTPFVLGWA